VLQVAGFCPLAQEWDTFAHWAGLAPMPEVAGEHVSPGQQFPVPPLAEQSTVAGSTPLTQVLEVFWHVSGLAPGEPLLVPGTHVLGEQQFPVPPLAEQSTVAGSLQAIGGGAGTVQVDLAGLAPGTGLQDSPALQQATGPKD
jgi:hypothetical protein